MIIKINSTKNDKIRRLSDFTPASLARSTLYLLDDYILSFEDEAIILLLVVKQFHV